MDDEFYELEEELKRLRPVSASPLLAARVEHALRDPRRNYWRWAALPAAAALAGAVLLRENQPLPVSGPSPTAAGNVVTYKPVSAQNLLYEQQDGGLVTLADGTTARRYLNSYVDTITWKNPRTQASLRWSVPRTEVRVVPVSFQ